MGGFFNLDGPFYKYGTLLADIIILSVLWIITSLPIITIGTSTTALFYVMTKRINEKESYLAKDYFKSFKQNFKQSVVVGIVILFAFSLLVFNIRLMTHGQMFANSPFIAKVFIIFYMALFFELTLVSIYIFPLLARFELKFKELFKTAFFLANKHFPSSFSIVIIIAAIIFLITRAPFIIFIGIGLYAALSSFFFMRIFRKYKPEMDEYIDPYDTSHKDNL